MACLGVDRLLSPNNKDRYVDAYMVSISLPTCRSIYINGSVVDASGGQAKI